MGQSDRRDLYNGFGDALSRAFELVVTPAIFGWLGWLLDHRLGTTPLFTMTLAFLVFLYVGWRLWTGYESDMRDHEGRLPARRRTGTRP